MFFSRNRRIVVQRGKFTLLYLLLVELLILRLGCTARNSLYLYIGVYNRCVCLQMHGLQGSTLV